jgi:hypothetical protein
VFSKTGKAIKEAVMIPNQQGNKRRKVTKEPVKKDKKE